MGKIIGCLRSFVQLKLLVESLLCRYARIIKNSIKLTGYVFRLIFVSVNYLAALILLPIVVFFLTHIITKDYLIPIIVSIAAVGVYLIFMSNYFSKGMHQFGENAKEIKQLSHSMGVEHRLALRALKEDNMSSSLFVYSTILIMAEFILFYHILMRFGARMKIRNIILGFILIQIVIILIEYSKAGHKLFGFRMPKLDFLKKNRKYAKEKKDEEKDKDGKEIKEKSEIEEKKKEEKEFKIPSNYKKSDDFDDLIIAAEPEENKDDANKKNFEEE